MLEQRPGVCPTDRKAAYYDRNNLKVEDRSLSPFKDYIDFDRNRWVSKGFTLWAIHFILYAHICGKFT